VRRARPLAVLLAAVGLMACGEQAPPALEESSDPGPIHVHGLGVNPADGALFIATHTGLFRAPAGHTRSERVADRYQDTMGFAVVGPDRFLGSGHPDAREELPPFLGLIASQDAGKTWRPVSLMGEVDFHVIAAAGRTVYGFGSNFDTRQPDFLASSDGGRTWGERTPPEPLVDLVIDPADPAHVVAGGEGGLFASRDGGRRWRGWGDGEPGLLSWSPSGRLYRVADDGGVAVSGDAGRTWREAGSLGGEPGAFELGARGELLAALHDGTVKQSRDDGRTWTVRSVPTQQIRAGG